MGRIPQESQSLDQVDPDSSVSCEAPETVGSDLRVALPCPKCDHAGWISWRNLGRALRCPACKCQFQIGRLGKLELRRDLPPVRYECPRCRQSGELPPGLAVRGVECAACQLNLVLGPDQKLHDEKEVTQLRVERRKKSSETYGSQDKNPWMSQGAWTPRLGYLAIGISAVLSLWYIFSGTSPAKRVEHFTYECLAEDWSDALEYVIDDPVQQTEFDRWRVRHFSSILDKHRPRGDRVAIELQLAEQTEENHTYLVTMTSPHIGKRTHTQIWRLTEDEWRFDVRATLKTTERPVQTDRAATSKPKLPGRSKPLRP